MAVRNAILNHMVTIAQEGKYEVCQNERELPTIYIKILHHCVFTLTL